MFLRDFLLRVRRNGLRRMDVAREWSLVLVDWVARGLVVDHDVADH